MNTIQEYINTVVVPRLEDAEEPKRFNMLVFSNEEIQEITRALQLMGYKVSYVFKTNSLEQPIAIDKLVVSR
jgi:hypothetical protein